MVKTTEELTNSLFLELKKEFINDTLAIMKSACPEYITEQGVAYLDGITATGQYPEVVSLLKYNEKVTTNFELLAEITEIKESDNEIEKLTIKINKQSDEIKKLNGTIITNENCIDNLTKENHDLKIRLDKFINRNPKIVLQPKKKWYDLF